MLLKEQILLDKSVPAGENFTFGDHISPHYVGVVLNGDGEAVTPNQGDAVDGWIIPKASIGEQVRLVLSGIIPIKSAAANAVGLDTGLLFSVDANGRGREAVGATTGIVLSPVATAGDIFSARVDVHMHNAFVTI